MNGKDYFLKELAGINEVPTLPQVAFKLISLISDENSSMRQISNLIEEDPPLVAKILRIVNSGYYSVPKEVQSVRQAVVLLGLDEIRNLVFAMSVFSSFYHIHENEHFNFLGFWKHSAATGKVASVLSTYLNMNSVQSGFIGGLLHDFGRLIFQLYFPDEYQKVFEYSIENQVGLYAAEQAAIGFCHDDAGYWLAQKWNLPEDLSNIIRDHHRIDEAQVEEKTLVALVHVSERITNIWGIGIEPVPLMETLEDNPVWKKLLQLHPKLQAFPLEEMTRVFDMHLEEAEAFVDEIAVLHGKAEEQENEKRH